MAAEVKGESMAKKKRKLTKAEKLVRTKHGEMYEGIFVNGKQKRIKREPLVEGLPVDEFLRHNADPLWLHQEGLWELIDSEDN